MWSAAYGLRILLTSFGVALFMLAYNECGGARGHWLVRNGLNVIGYALADAGETLVTCQNESEADDTIWISVALSAGVILTTIHPQNYKDIRGDIAAGRVTLLIAYLMLFRAVTSFLLIGWSWGISRTWYLDYARKLQWVFYPWLPKPVFVARTDPCTNKVSFN